MGGGFFLVIIVLFAFMYLLLIRPQKQQQRRQQDMLAALKPGDEVITVGGIYGDVVEVDDDRVALEVAEDVEIEVSKRAIASVVPPEEPAEETVDVEPDALAAEDETDLEAAPEAQPDNNRPVTQEEPAGR